jgi:hypothetical protein
MRRTQGRTRNPARSRTPRPYGRRDGSPEADGPTPVFAESLLHGGRTTVAAGATPLVVTRDIATAGPGAGAPLHRTPPRPPESE